MRVHKYEADLDNGNTIRISGAGSEASARRLAEESVARGNGKCEGATKVVTIRLVQRGIWG